MLWNKTAVRGKFAIKNYLSTHTFFLTNHLCLKNFYYQELLSRFR